MLLYAKIDTVFVNRSLFCNLDSKCLLASPYFLSSFQTKVKGTSFVLEPEYQRLLPEMPVILRKSTFRNETDDVGVKPCPTAWPALTQARVTEEGSLP